MDNISRLSTLFQSRRGKNIILYFLCVCVALVFWVFITLDEESTRDVELPLAVENVPDSVVFLSSLPKSVNVVVQGRGYQFVRHTFGSTPVLKFNFNEISPNDHQFNISNSKLENKIRETLGQGVKINSIRPDSVSSRFTTEPGVLVPVISNVNVASALQYVINGPVTMSADSVMVYRQEGKNIRISHVETEDITRDMLKDTTVITAHIIPIEGARIIPDRVYVTVPVEPLIAKRKSVQISRINIPENMNAITFPSSVEINYLVPMSKFNDDFPITVFVDFNTVERRDSKARLFHSPLPEWFKNFTMSTDSVEYIIDIK